MKPRKMTVVTLAGKAFGTFDGISWFQLNEPGKVPHPERYYVPDLKYEVGGRIQAIKDIRESFGK